MANTTDIIRQKPNSQKKQSNTRSKFELVSDFKPTGDQPQAINSLVAGVKKSSIQTLLGVTGSGKTFSIANVVAKTGKNTLVISHNKTLAAQLYEELRQFFPKNNVGYFVSYYDYYQPESYLPQTDTYIEKDTQINEKIEKMRLEATAMLLSGEPTIIVATVSCIYSLGNPADWEDMSVTVSKANPISRNTLVKKFLNARYERNDTEVAPGNFRVIGDTIDIMPAYSQDLVRIFMFGDEIEKIVICDHVSLVQKQSVSQIRIFPAKHYIIADDVRLRALKSIKKELSQRLSELDELQRQRLEMRTNYDIEMIEELGYCSGIENYSRHFDGRSPGQKAFCLLDFFGDDYLLVIDESHVTLPQLHGMYKGDFSRKKQLVDYGFRLPSAYDNRPLKYEEFEKYIKNTIFTSATPSAYEKGISKNIVEQLIRPTGLVDPTVEVRPTTNQIDDLIQEINKRSALNERVLVTTLTKRMAEDVTEYLASKQIKARYLHADIEGLQRTELLRQLRLGEYDVLVGINLLREGIDLPEVSLVAILDASREGFLRNTTSLIQTFGRAARNVKGAVIMYSDTITDSMKSAIQETNRRRKKQMAHNKKYKITPKTIIKSIAESLDATTTNMPDNTKTLPIYDLNTQITDLQAAMTTHSQNLEYEAAIECRDQINRIKKEITHRAEKREEKRDIKDKRGKTSQPKKH